jgi:cytochrome b6-f complex iron-sulfur subunit
MNARAERRRPLLTGIAVVTAIAAVVGTFGLVVTQVGLRSPGPGWVHAASVDDLQRVPVVHVPLARAFVVVDGSSPIALYARSPHQGKPISYCESSGWFEDRAHGSRFDRLGRYVLGPAPRGLDRLDVEIVGGEVWVNTTHLMLGPPRGEPTDPPFGPFCPTG